MSKIIDFPQAPKTESLILGCMTCGETEFYLRMNGDIECASCDTRYHGLAWGYDEESEPQPPTLAA